MLHTPVLRSHLHLTIVQPDKVFLLSESTQHVVRGRSSLRVIELIDGARSTDEIVTALNPDISMLQVYYVLTLLEKHGYIQEACPEVPTSASAYWHAFGIDSCQAHERLMHATVRVITVGMAAPEPLLDLLAAVGLRRLDTEEADFWVVVCDDYLRDELGAINQAALGLGKSWLLVRPNGIEVWVGPLFRPQVTGCWMCLQARIRTNRATESHLRYITGQPLLFPARAVLPSTYQLALSMAAHEICCWIAADYSVLEGKIRSFHTKHLQVKEHMLIRKPHCAACGDYSAASRRSIEPIVLSAGVDAQAYDGGYRNILPEMTIRSYSHLISSICGVVTELKRISDEKDWLCHVYSSGSNQAMGYRTYGTLLRNMRSFNAGKGVTDSQAQASAMCEAIERYSGCFQGNEQTVLSSMQELGDSAIDPRLCMLYSVNQYQNRKFWNSRQNPFEHVPLPFDPKMTLSWSPIWSMTRNEVRYLPTSYCYYNFQGQEKHSFCTADSNGCASGNTLEEAILQGFLELVERDCVAIWWYNRIRRPAVDLASFEDPYITKLQEWYRCQHRDLWVLDVSNDFGIAAFVAISCRIGQPIEMIVFAAGCHLDPHIALLRSLTELNQVVVGLGDPHLLDNRQLEHMITVQWLRHATLATEPYLVPDPALPARRKQDISHLGGTDLRDNILLCQSLVEQRGMELLVLDQTREDIGMPVVKVVVPEMRFFWARFAPGRLYDVPVQLGWLPIALREEQLNPKTIFI